MLALGTTVKVALDRPYPQNGNICYPQGPHALDSTWKKSKRKDELCDEERALRDGMQKRRCGWTESANVSRGRKQKTGNSVGI